VDESDRNSILRTTDLRRTDVEPRQKRGSKNSQEKEKKKCDRKTTQRKKKQEKKEEPSQPSENRRVVQIKAALASRRRL